VRDREREELHPGPLGADSRDDGLAAAVGEVDVEEDDVRVELVDERHRLGDRPGFADDVDPVAELAADAGPEERVVVDEDDAQCHGRRSSRSSTSVPSPGVEVIVAVPPARASRASIDSAMPRRSAGTVLRSNPAPRSRMKTLTTSSSASAYTATS